MITISKNNRQIIHDILKCLPIFSDLFDEQLNKISAICKIQDFQKNDTIFLEGDYYKGFFIIIEGSIKIFKISVDGKESILHLLKPYESFGDVPLFEGAKYPVNAQALNDASLIFIPKEEFITLIKSNSTICFNMLVGFAKKMRHLTQKVEELSSKEVMNRFAGYLLDEINKSGTENLPEPFVKISISKKNIASYIGTITDTLSRLLKKLQDEKIIRVSGKSIFILDLKKLKALAR